MSAKYLKFLLPITMQRRVEKYILDFIYNKEIYMFSVTKRKYSAVWIIGPLSLSLSLLFKGWYFLKPVPTVLTSITSVEVFFLTFLTSWKPRRKEDYIQKKKNVDPTCLLCETCEFYIYEVR